MSRLRDPVATSYVLSLVVVQLHIAFDCLERSEFRNKVVLTQNIPCTYVRIVCVTPSYCLDTSNIPVPTPGVFAVTLEEMLQPVKCKHLVIK
jgi:hypothetical protein